MKPINDKFLWDMIDRLREEIEQLQKDNNSFHGQFDEIQELKSEVERYKFHAETRANELVKRGAKLKELQADNKRLMNQVSSNSGNSSSTHTHTIKKEIAEYMSMNDKCKGARLFIIPIEAFDGNGIYDANYGDVYYKDGME